MPKQERNKQFVEIEKKIGTYFLKQDKSVEREPIHFQEFSEIKRIIETESGNIGMCPSEFIRWIYLRYLSIKGLIPVEIEKQHPEYVTYQDLGFNSEHDCNIAERRANFSKRNFDDSRREHIS